MRPLLKKLLPPTIRIPIFSAYHLALAWLGALIYRHPSRDLFVLAVTGTKGKTTTVELIRAILEHAGYKVATISTLQFTIAGEHIPNTYKMSMPGRFFMQHFLRRAVTAGCDYAIVEMTSEGATQHRQRFIDLDALIFTNLAPEHIESHGSYEAYLDAKLMIAQQLEDSNKKNKTILVNGDDAEANRFLGIHVPNKKTYRKIDAEPITKKDGNLTLTYAGKQISTQLKGDFDAYNILAAITFAQTQSIGITYSAKAIQAYKGTRGRMEYVHTKDASVPFSVVVDYAHTPHSLEAVYRSIKGQKICVLGATGGGRDTWKRPEFGKIAATHCDAIILTNEDPYDEDPLAIIHDITKGIPCEAYNTIIDRRKAIREAIKAAPRDSTVIITGKGTDPYIMGAAGTKIPWDDATVVREELNQIRLRK